MALEKVTEMVLKVDLQCPSCYKKTKKTLCKFPQVRDQKYDEKANTVTITVVCCSPEKIRDKLCCKGGKAIKSITIVESGKPKASDKPKEPEKPKDSADKPKEKDKPKGGPEKPKVVIVEPKDMGKPKPKEPEKPKDMEKAKDTEKPKPNGKADKPKPKPDGPPPVEMPADKPKHKPDGAPPAKKPADEPKGAPMQMPGPMPGPGPAKGPGPMMVPFPVEQMKGPPPAPVQGVPSVFPYVGPSYDGYNAGPYYHGYGFPAPAQPVYHEGYYDNGHGSGYGYGYGYMPGRFDNVNRYGDSYFTDENPQVCSIM